MKPQKLFMLRNNLLLLLLLLLWVCDDMRQLAANISRSIFLAAYQKGGKTPAWGAAGVRQGRQGGTKCTHTAYINQFQLTLIKYASSGHDHSNRQQQQQQQSSVEERDRQRDGEKKDAAQVWSEIKRMDSQLGLHQVQRGEGDWQGGGVGVESGAGTKIKVNKWDLQQEPQSKEAHELKQLKSMLHKLKISAWQPKHVQLPLPGWSQLQFQCQHQLQFQLQLQLPPLSLSLVFSVRACVAVRVLVFCGYALGLTAMRPKPNKQAKRQQHQQQQQQNEPESVAQWQIAGAAQVNETAMMCPRRTDI